MQKQFILMLWVFIIPITHTNAQATHQDSTDSYDQLKNWAVIQLTTAYIEDLRNWTSSTNEDEVKRSQKREFTTYQTLINEYGEPIEYNLDDVSDLLINGDWKGTESSVFRGYKEELAEEGNIDFREIYYVPSKAGVVHREIAINGIQEQYNLLLPKEKTPEISDKEKVVEKEKKEERSETLVDNVKRERKYLTYFLLTLLFVSILLNGFLYKSKRDLDKKVKRLKQDLEKQKDKNRLPNQTDGNIIANQTNEINRLSSQLISIQEKIRAKDSEIENLRHRVSNEGGVTHSQEWNGENEVQNSTSNSVIHYLSRPIEPLLFAGENALNSMDSDSIYKVTVTDQSGQGVLEIIENADFTRALNSPNAFLEYACIFNNEFNTRARSIRMVEKGSISLEGNDWRVSKKVRIEFI